MKVIFRKIIFKTFPLNLSESYDFDDYYKKFDALDDEYVNQNLLQIVLKEDDDNCRIKEYTFENIETYAKWLCAKNNIEDVNFICHQTKIRCESNSKFVQETEYIS